MEIKNLKSQYLESNVFICINGKDCVIIDAGVETALIEKEVGNLKVTAVLLTHGHYDHAMFALDYAKKFDCKIYASEFAKDELIDPAKNYGESFKLDSFDNFEFIKEDGKLNFEDFEIQFFATPGHCKSSVCFLLNNHLFAGDTLFDNGIGRTDLYGSSKEEIICSLEKLDALEFETCHSGHGEDSEFARQKRNIKAFIRFLKR